MNGFDLRPRTVGEVLDAGIRLAFGNVRTLVPLVACVAVPLQLVWAIVLLATVSHGSEVSRSLFALHVHFVREPNGTLRSTGPALSPGVLAGGFLVPTLVQLLSTAACVRALGDIVAGGVPSVLGSLGEMVRRLPALVALYLLRFLGTVLGLLLLIVPGVWVAGAWSVSVPACVLEGAGPWHALQRSERLVRRRWWPVVGVILVADLAVGIISGVLQAVFDAIAGGSGHPRLLPAVLAVTLGAVVAELLVQPVTAAVRTGLYLDLRIRRGGDELAALADQLGVPALDPEPLDPSGRPGAPPY